MTYDQAFAELTGPGPWRGYGPVAARGLLHAATVHGAITDEYPRDADGVRHGVRIGTLNDAGTAFVIRDITIQPLRSELTS
jgi:hypothetical protein